MADRIIELGANHRIIVDDTANTWKLQFYDSAAGVWKDIIGYDTSGQKITTDLDVNKDTPATVLRGTETNAKTLAVRENAGKLEIYDVGAGNTIPGPSKLQSVKRNASGAVVFTGVGTISTAATATGTYTTKTTNVGPVSFSQAILKLAGAFTTAKAIIKRNGSTLTSLTATGTVTVTNSNLGLTGTNTWTLSATMSAGTSITATATVNKDSRQTINIR